MSLMNYLPGHYAESDEVKRLQSALGGATDTLKADVTDLINQLYVASATWGLKYWEDFLGIHNPLPTYESRREIIMSTLRGAGTTTKEMIKSLAAAFSGGEVDVIEDNSHYKFTVKFVGAKGVPPNMMGLIDAIEKAKPAHLTYTFEYTYMTWAQHDSFKKTWAEWDALNLTWAEFEKYE